MHELCTPILSWPMRTVGLTNYRRVVVKTDKWVASLRFCIIPVMQLVWQIPNNTIELRHYSKEIEMIPRPWLLQEGKVVRGGIKNSAATPVHQLATNKMMK